MRFTVTQRTLSNRKEDPKREKTKNRKLTDWTPKEPKMITHWKPPITQDWKAYHSLLRSLTL